MPPHICTRIIFIVLAWLWPFVVTASSLTAPLLTIQPGKLSQAGRPPMTLDRTSLLALPQSSMETGVPWHEGPARFEGPLLSSLMESLGVHGETLVVTGLDGYSIRIALAEAYEMDAMMAHSCNGKFLSIRDLGPLILLYPKGEGFSSQQRMFRTVWQVSHIRVE